MSAADLLVALERRLRDVTRQLELARRTVVRLEGRLSALQIQAAELRRRIQEAA